MLGHSGGTAAATRVRSAARGQAPEGRAAICQREGGRSRRGLIGTLTVVPRASRAQLKSISKALKEIGDGKEEGAELDAKKAALQKRYVALAHGSTQMLLCLGLLGFYNKPRLTGFFGVCTSALVRRRARTAPPRGPTERARGAANARLDPPARPPHSVVLPAPARDARQGEERLRTPGRGAGRDAAAHGWGAGGARGLAAA